MRRVFLAIVLLAFGVNAMAQQVETVSAITPSGTVTQVTKKPLFHVSEALAPYVNNFLKSLKADNWKLNHFILTDFVVIFSHEIDFDMSGSGPKSSGAAGIALGMKKDDLVYVVINTEVWLDASDFVKQDLINHELMHDMFNVMHTDLEKEDKLMHPTSYPKDWGETMVRLVDAISDLNLAYEQ